ncbi:MAG: hypothetical protein RXR08_09345 [Sulfolobaceae archaeon]
MKMMQKRVEINNNIGVSIPEVIYEMHKGVISILHLVGEKVVTPYYTIEFRLIYLWGELSVPVLTPCNAKGGL